MDARRETNGRRPRVLILGGAFAGIGAAQELKDADADVVLIDKHDYHAFQPLLCQVAIDLLKPATVGHPRPGRGAVPARPDDDGQKASLAWGAVHLELLSSGEDRAKAVVDWTWAGASHDRPGRITLHTEAAQR